LANDAEVLISANGRIIAFCSAATNLVQRDTNGAADLFTYDRQTGLTERVTVSSTGAQADKGDRSRIFALSADGRFVLFRSDAANLVANDTNNLVDIFVRDRTLKSTERVNISSTGAQANGASETLGGISANGRFVTFASRATNLGSGAPNHSKVFVHDRQGKSTVSVSGGFADALYPAISGNGRFVVYSALNGGVRNIYVYDRTTKRTTLVSRGLAGAPSNGNSEAPSISTDGIYIAYVSDATNLVPSDTNGTRDVFAFDLLGKETIRASIGRGGIQANGPSPAAAIAPGGYYLAFVSNATNLVPRDTNDFTDVFVGYADVD
jgi:Tol biopolymer transport system component